MSEWKYQYCRDCVDGNCDMRITDEVICENYKPKPQTNADRIRAMTDEELAEFIGDDAMHDICPNDCQDDLDRPCKVCALGWLKQEASDG